MKYPLVVAGSDPTGGAGLQADIRTLSSYGLHPLSAVTCITVQGGGSFKVAESVDGAIISEQIDALLRGFDVGVVKVGLLFSRDAVEHVSMGLASIDAPIVVDPVLSSSVGGDEASEGTVEAYRESLLKITTVLTPNVGEAEALLGISIKDLDDVEDACRDLTALGPQYIVVKGGHFDGDVVTDTFFDGEIFERVRNKRLPGSHHGTGCVFSSSLAASLLLGKSHKEAFVEANRFVNRAMAAGKLDFGGQMLLGPNEGRDPIKEDVRKAVDILVERLPMRMVPEVGMNIAYAKEDAGGPQDVCALTGRIHRVGESISPLGSPEYGASKHIARIVLTAMTHDRTKRSACNLRYLKDVKQLCQENGLAASGFSREDQPPDTSSMEWGTEAAIRSFGYVPDVIFDQGDVGKEAMMRVLGRDPDDVVKKVLLLSKAALGSKGS